MVIFILCIYLSIYLFIYLSIYLFVYLTHMVMRKVLSMQIVWQVECEYQFIADNNTAEARSENRRVETTTVNFQFKEYIVLS